MFKLLLIQLAAAQQLISNYKSIIFENEKIVEINMKNVPINSTLLFKITLEPLKYKYIYQLNSLPICLVTTKNASLKLFNFTKKPISIIDNSSDPKYFDYEAMLTASITHLVQIQITPQLLKFIQNQTLYLTVGDITQNINQFQLNFLLYLKPFNNEDSLACINDCQQYSIGKAKNKQCQNGRCTCGYRQFGAYCQLTKEVILLDVLNNIIIRTHQWKYLTLHIDSFQDLDLSLEITGLYFNISISFSFEGIAKEQVPSAHQNTFFIKASGGSQIYLISEWLSKYIQMIQNQNLSIAQPQLYVGFFNPSNEFISFNVLFSFGNSSRFTKFLKENYIIIIILSTNIFSAFIFICITTFMKQHQRDENNINDNQNQNAGQRQQRRQARRKKRKQGIIIKYLSLAFKSEFVEQYFPGYPNQIILQWYPALAEIDECVICLEGMTMALAEDPGMNMCSVTPCYHMFHSDCLKKWFLTSKLCPFCRAQFNESSIIKMKKWLHIPSGTSVSQTPQASSNRVNRSEYVKRMKQKKTMPLNDEMSNLDNNTSSAQFINNNNVSQLETSQIEQNGNTSSALPGNILQEIMEEEEKQINQNNENNQQN